MLCRIFFTNIKFVICLLAGFLLLSGIALAQVEQSTAQQSVTAANTVASKNVRLIGHIGGSTSAVYVQNNIAYIGEGVRLTILNISNPSEPIFLGKTEPMIGIVSGVVVAVDIAYVITGKRFYLFDVSSPVAPYQLGFVDTTSGSASSFYVSGQYAYIADRYEGLQIVDVSDPAAPTEIGSFDTPSSSINVYVSGKYAYVADVWELRIIDVSNPAAPKEVGVFDTLEDVFDVYVSGQYAYVADYYEGLRVVDVSNPAVPTEVGAFDPVDGITRVYVAEQYAYVRGLDGFLRIVDVSDPAAPTEVSFIDTPGFASDVYVSGQYAYVADGGAGLRVVDVSNPTTPTEVGSFDMVGYPRGVYVSGQYAYVADGDAGLRVFDVSNPAAPTEVGSLETPGTASGIYVSEQYAYISDEFSGLWVVDVSDPASPTEVSFIDTPGIDSGVYVSGQYAYVAEGFLGIQIIDISNPASPTKVGSLNNFDYANSVYVSGRYAYVTDERGLWVVDVLDPAAPTEVSSFDTPGSASDVYVSGQYAYVADGNAGLRVVDVSNPATPTEVGSLDTSGSASSVYVSGQYAYITDRYRLGIFDVSNPALPTEVGFFDKSGSSTESIYVYRHYVYVTDGDAGLYVLRYPPCYLLQLNNTGLGSIIATEPINSDGCLLDEYLPGASITLRATPKPGWRVSGWSGTNNDSSVSQVNQLTMPAADHELIVNYAPICYALTLTHTGDGEDPSAEPTNSDGCAFGQYRGGETITLQAAPAIGYTIGSWRDTDDDSSIGTENSFTMPTSDYSVGVNYVPACYPLNIEHVGSGGAPNPTPTQSGSCAQGQYHFKEAVTLSVNPALGWQVGAWSGTVNNTITTTTNSLVMPASEHKVTVHYAEVPAPAPGDVYELDDSCSRSTAITTDGSEQQAHTFHEANDIDWVHFDATAGTSYRVEVVVPDSSNADVVIESYRDCDSSLGEQSSPGFSVGARLDISRTVSGPTWLRLAPVHVEHTGANASYQISVRNMSEPPANRALIIVAGRLKEVDPVQYNIDEVAQRVYKLFQGKGYEEENIFLLSTDAEMPGRDGSPTKAALKSAILEWAAPRVKNGVLTLYMVDHGAEEKFYLDNIVKEILTPAELDDWLDELEQDVQNIKINVVIEACQSGSFISPDGGTISGTGRVVLTSSNQTEDAKASNEGAYFSDHLLTWLQQDYSVRKSFEEASAAAKTVYSLQDAWLDANGDGIVNKEEDYRLAAQRGFAFSGTLPSDEWAPEFFAVEQFGKVENDSVLIDVDVRDDESVSQVWVVVYPPDYEPPPASEELRPEVLPTHLFTRIDSKNKWQAQVTGLQQQGIYRLIIHAEDGSGKVARPAMLEVDTANGRHIFLPLVTR